MRLSSLSLILLFSFSVLFAAQEKKYVQPTKEGTGVYKNEVRGVYEEPAFTVNPSDMLGVIEEKGRAYKVSGPNGQEGWVEKRLVVAVGKSKTFVFDNAEVIGYLDNPTPVYIIDTDDPNADPINLDRSFKDALKENVDKETVERQTK